MYVYTVCTDGVYILVFLAMYIIIIIIIKCFLFQKSDTFLSKKVPLLLSLNSVLLDSDITALEPKYLLCKTT